MIDSVRCGPAELVKTEQIQLASMEGPAEPTVQGPVTSARFRQGACWRGRPVSLGCASSSCLALSFVTNSW